MYKEWQPKDLVIPKKFLIEGIHDDYEGFRIIIRDLQFPREVFRILFLEQLGYRNFDELDRVADYENFPNSSEGCSIFKTTKSEFIEWIRNSAGPKFDDMEIFRFTIISLDDYVEVLAFKDPIIEKLSP